jgi:glycosyltransferase involved in cell wall biosynthesis
MKTTRPNILCLEQYATVGGGQQSLLDLLPSFVEYGWFPQLVVPGAGPMQEIVESMGFPVHTIATGSYSILRKPAGEIASYLAEQPRQIAALGRLARRQQIALLYVNGPRLLPAASLVSKVLRIPLLFHCHNRLIQRSAAVLAGRSLQLTKAQMMACCQFTAEPLSRFVSGDRLHVIFNGVADMSVASSRRPRSRIMTIGVIGRIESQKGQWEFVQAAHQITRVRPDVAFKIVGSPMFSDRSYYESVVSASKGLPLSFQSWTPEISRVFSDLDLLVVPSKAVEATTRVILEAFSAHVPVVCFRSGGIQEVVQDNVTGFFTADVTAGSLAARILEVLELSEEELNQVRYNARLEWLARFTLPRYRSHVAQVIRSTLEARNAAPAGRRSRRWPAWKDEPKRKAAVHSD